jgi:hypothetical protein
MFRARLDMESLSIAKFYGFPRSSSLSDLVGRSVELASELGVAPKVYSVNYKNRREYSANALMQDIGRADRGTNLEYIDISPKLEWLGLVISRPLRRFGMERVMHVALSFVPPSSLPALFEDVSRKLAEVFEIQYGYGGTLPAGYEPSSERKIERSLFGGTLKVSSAPEKWIRGPEFLDEWAVKDLYQVNLVKKQAIESSFFRAIEDVCVMKQFQSDLYLVIVDPSNLGVARERAKKLSSVLSDHH